MTTALPCRQHSKEYGKQPRLNRPRPKNDSRPSGGCFHFTNEMRLSLRNSDAKLTWPRYYLCSATKAYELWSYAESQDAEKPRLLALAWFRCCVPKSGRLSMLILTP